MNDAIQESASAAARAAARSQTTSEQAGQLEQLAQAMANNALLNTEVDRKIVSRLMETREEIAATQRQLEGLRQEFAQFARAVGQVIEAARSEWQRQTIVARAPQPVIPNNGFGPEVEFKQ